MGKSITLQTPCVSEKGTGRCLHESSTYCAHMRLWAWVTSTHKRAGHSVTICNCSAGEVKDSRRLLLPVKSKWQAPDSVKDPALNHKVEIRYRGTYLMSILDLRTHLTCSHGQDLESVRAAFISMFPSNKLTVQMKSSFKYSISNWHKKKTQKTLPILFNCYLLPK